jgi:apolipoprotein N-acyltransferase
MRATSNGITAVIGPDGTVLMTIPQFKPGILKSTVEPRTGLTPYARTGNWPILSLSFLLLIAFAVARLRARNRS